MAVKKDNSKMVQRREGYVSKIVPKTISRTRADISSWKNALRAADNVENPRRARLQNLYTDILLDAHLTSQIELRMQHSLSVPFVLKRESEIDEKNTALLKAARWKNEIDREILWADYRGNSLIELTTENNTLCVTSLPRNNIIPEKGILLLSEDDTTGIDYRNCREYGTWLLEFG